ncbi:ABC transporter ATP-binding protein [Cohnella thailandensis]|uniref:ATP-binding cassette domain-containing protein n=1 Tax=Cohnella thailandensis TaxID=557557 RepID=A0A841TAK1_9BACL|nr:oligopeptide/dipeptide ABC transporter ATP-binding protein [Cohnella thailandensis]MBB6638251.1 ATP-binding cassette domain-containing protein [Cohnella thailandensis]MBP1977812.1 oligopeptide transport system ATP-binding protein [Cohnella thailandensis]
MSAPEAILELHHIEKSYAPKRWLSRGETLRAVDGVSLSVRKGETLGIVGESGCGKSTIGQIASLMLRPTGGSVVFKGEELVPGRRSPRDSRRSRIQYVFQDPYSSLNPRFTIGRLLEEPLAIRKKGTRRERRREVLRMLSRIGLDPAYADRYPHELSGGQRQRVGIARALMPSPELLVLDEPVSALDVSVQAQILNLLKDLQAERSLTYLFISHDLNVVHYMSDRVAVMYLGRIVELAEVGELYDGPLHPYTRALVDAIPDEPGTTPREAEIIEGELPDPRQLAGGCAFRARCPFAHERCGRQPLLEEVKPGHYVACHLLEPDRD